MKPVYPLFVTGVGLSLGGSVMQGIILALARGDRGGGTGGVFFVLIALGLQLAGLIVLIVAGARGASNLDELAQAREREMRDAWRASGGRRPISPSQPTAFIDEPRERLINATDTQREALERIEQWYRS